MLVRKKDGGVRWCIDYRALNNVTVKDAFPLPRIEECLDTLAKATYMSTLDLASGYWQLEVAEEDRHKTTFITRHGLSEHICMGFGLCSAPATFSRAMRSVLHGLLWGDVLAYLDDVIVLGLNFKIHLTNLVKVFQRLCLHNLKLKPRKCVLFREEVKFWGKIMSRRGISVNPVNIEKVSDWPIPKNVNEVEIFLGFMNYHREHLKDCAGRAPLAGGRGRAVPIFKWSDCHQVAFEELKNAMSKSPILGFPLADSLFILDTNASDAAIGAELLQIQDGKE